MLEMPCVNMKDNGRYKCVAKNTKGEVFHSAALKGKELIHPPEFSGIQVSYQSIDKPRIVSMDLE